MTRKSLLLDATAALTAAHDPEAPLHAELLLAHVLGIERLWMLLSPQETVSTETAARFYAMVECRCHGRAMGYVLGYQDFMGHRFHIDERVLVPRYDTEILAEATLQRLASGMRCVDIGTGSGALAVTMALACPDAEVWAVDHSLPALEVAKANAARLGATVHCVHGDLFDGLSGAFDLIVSNPPYIPTNALPHLPPDVRSEPTMALDGGTDGLTLYRRMAEGLSGVLAPNGTLLLEFGDGQENAIQTIFTTMFEKTTILKDWGMLPRVFIGEGYAGETRMG